MELHHRTRGGAAHGAATLGRHLVCDGQPGPRACARGTAGGAAFAGLENLTENLGIEPGPFGIKVVCLRTLANLDSGTIMDSVAAANFTMEQGSPQFAVSTFL